MDALVMCGGQGTRLDADVEKPLLEICGRPMIDHVLDALAASQVDATYAIVSPHTPDTRAHVAGIGGVPTIETPGAGYVPDLARALSDDCVEPPVLSVAADLPLLTAEVIDDVLEAYAAVVAEHADGGQGERGVGPSMTVAVPVALKDRLGVSVDTTMDDHAPTGVNVIGDRAPELTHVASDPRLAVNVNRPGDAHVAEARRQEGGRPRRDDPVEDGCT